MTNQASEGGRDTDTQIMHKIDNILYSEHEQPFSKGDALLMLIRNQIKAHVRTEKLKLLAEVRERVVGEDELYATDEAGWGELASNREKMHANKVKSEQRVELTKLEAEL